MSSIILSAGAPRRIGFISTRFHGTDGVTLEAAKWAYILAGPGADRSHQRNGAAHHRASSRFLLGTRPVHGQRGERLFESGLSARPATRGTCGHKLDGTEGTCAPMQFAVGDHPERDRLRNP